MIMYNALDAVNILCVVKLLKNQNAGALSVIVLLL